MLQTKQQCNPLLCSENSNFRPNIAFKTTLVCGGGYENYYCSRAMSENRDAGTKRAFLTTHVCSGCCKYCQQRFPIGFLKNTDYRLQQVHKITHMCGGYWNDNLQWVYFRPLKQHPYSAATIKYTNTVNRKCSENNDLRPTLALNRVLTSSGCYRSTNNIVPKSVRKLTRLGLIQLLKQHLCTADAKTALNIIV